MPEEIQQQNGHQPEPKQTDADVIDLLESKAPAEDAFAKQVASKEFQASLQQATETAKRYHLGADGMSPKPETNHEQGAEPPVKPKAEAKEPEKPAPAKEPLKPGLGQSLIERAREMGLGQDELGDDPAIAERIVGAAERAYIRQMRQFQQQQPGPEQKQQQKEEPKKDEDDPIFGKDKDLFDPRVQEAFGRMQAMFKAEIAKRDSVLEQVYNHIQQQHVSQGRSTLDKIADTLADEGWDAQVGKGQLRPGTAQYEARYEKLARAMSHQLDLYQQLGKTLGPDEWPELARATARLLWGPPSARQQHQQSSQQQVDERQRDERGRFVPASESPPTATQQPTRRAGKPGYGWDAAVDTLRGGLAQIVKNGSFPDIHD